MIRKLSAEAQPGRLKFHQPCLYTLHWEAWSESKKLAIQAVCSVVQLAEQPLNSSGSRLRDETWFADPRQVFWMMRITRSLCKASSSPALQGQVVCCTWIQAGCPQSACLRSICHILLADSTAYWNALVHGRKRWMFLTPEDREDLVLVRGDA